MLMQYLPTTATACCFSTLLIHSRFDAYTFKILTVLCVIFDFTRWRQITLFLHRPWYFILHWHCCCSSLLTYNMRILLAFRDCTPYCVLFLHLSRTYSYCWCFFFFFLQQRCDVSRCADDEGKRQNASLWQEDVERLSEFPVNSLHVTHCLNWQHTVKYITFVWQCCT